MLRFNNLNYLFLERKRKRNSSAIRPSSRGRRTMRRPTWWSLRSAAASRSLLCRSCHQAGRADTAPAAETGADWTGSEFYEERAPTVQLRLRRRATKSTQYLLNDCSAKTQEWFIGWEDPTPKWQQIKYRNNCCLLNSIGKTKTRYGPLRFIRIWQKKLRDMHANMSLQYDLIVKIFSFLRCTNICRRFLHHSQITTQFSEKIIY